jgi:polysaccharide biosynthesis protein PslL
MLKYIDLLKALGIVSIVLGHIWTQTYSNFWLLLIFNVYIFFFISGYLARPEDFPKYLWNKCKTLVLPYFSWLILLQIIAYLFSPSFGQDLINLVFGGYRLTKWFGVFWFISVLFLTQQITNLIISKIKNLWILGSLILIIIILVYTIDIFRSRYFQLPFNAQSLGISIPIYLVGYLYKQLDLIRHKYFNYISILFFLVLSFLLFRDYTPQNIAFDIKYNHLGVPYISFVYAFLTVHLFFVISKFLVKFKNLISLISPVGQASGTIMYTHQAIHFILLLYTKNLVLISFTTIIFSILIHYLLLSNKLTKILWIADKSWKLKKLG